MTRPTRPEVSDPQLESTLEKVGFYIENYTANLDGISNDIKGIEKYLGESGIRLATSVVVSSVTRSEDDGWWQLDEHLEWGPDDEYPFEKSDARWRVMYRASRTPGRLDDGFYPSDLPETVERKPLIETPIATRLKCHRHLAALVNQIGKTVEVGPNRDHEFPF